MSSTVTQQINLDIQPKYSRSIYKTPTIIMNCKVAQTLHTFRVTLRRRERASNSNGFDLSPPLADSVDPQHHRTVRTSEMKLGPRR